MKLERANLDLEMYPLPDQKFKLAAVHHFVFNFAKEHGNVFSRQKYREYIREKLPDKQRQERVIRWNATTVRRMVEAGYLIERGREEYLVNPLAQALLKSRPQAFSLKENHRKLLQQHEDGVITVSALKAAHKHKPVAERHRQEKMIDGMVRNLLQNGYLEAAEHGKYRLSEQAVLTLALPPPSSQRSDRYTPVVKITSFDRHLLEVAEDGLISETKLAAHAKGESLQKRIKTLAEAGFIHEGRLTPELMERIGLAGVRAQDRALSLDKLTEQQRQILLDMRVFLNLTMAQMVKHIYNGNAELARNDIYYLEDKGLLRKDKQWSVYVLGEAGIELTNPLFPDQVRYKTKLYSKREEVGHDVLVYSAYKDLERQLLADGKRIISVKNDRQLRSEDAKQYGAMTGIYPDLRVTYYDPGLRKEVKHDLEIDRGYNEKIIGKKLSGGISNWYTDSVGQAMKIARTAAKIDKEQGKNKLTAHLSIFVIDEKGDVHKMKWW